MTTSGRQSIQFVDQAGNRGIAEQSKEIDANTSYLLPGRKDAPLTLNIDQVGELVEHLPRWLENGNFVTASSESRAKSA